MNWTFGIITAGNNFDKLSKICDSIYSQQIPKEQYEIIIVGGEPIDLANVIHIPFDESKKHKWITKKKNLIAENAKFNNLCIMHDYIILDTDWYKHFEDFGDDWDVCMNSVVNADGQRFRDWVTWEQWCKENHMIYLDYNDRSRTNEMYISGAYFCVKKEFLLTNPLDENLCWGQGEDVEWSNRIRNIWDYKCNSNSKVTLLKRKKSTHWNNPQNEHMKREWNRNND